ncbi:MAG: ATP-grasp domain-containing protein [Clostridiales bacterium]|nr:ATP-grasp domain-containing protein [Clostridiales bacterium]
MKKVLIVGAGDFQLPLVQKAAESYQVLLAAPVIGEAFQPYLTKQLLIDVRAREEILAFARAEQIDGVITDQTDIAVRTVAYVAQEMGLPGIGYETGRLFTDKALMRQKLAQLGIPQLPNRTVFSLAEAEDYYAQLGGAVIIKPLDTQGSRGVQAVRSADELREKYAEAARWSSNGGVIVERLATGREFVVEGLSFNYQFQNLTCGDTLYFDIPDAYAAKSRIMPSTADEELTNRVLELNRRIITGFGLKQGITHSEYIMDGDEIYLMETAARGGGVFISSDLISLSTGLCTEEFLLNIATGQQTEMPEILPQQCYCGYMAFYIPVGKVTALSGVEEVQALPYVHRNQLDKLRLGMENREGHTDKTSRLALIVSAPTREELNRRMKNIQSLLRVEVSTENGVRGLIWA